MHNPVEIIRKKRNGKGLSHTEIEFFLNQYLRGHVADYQVSAWLMAAFLNGLSIEEMASLTTVMRDSGKTLKWPGNQKVIDKHSTGGVGDKTSLVILPLCCLEGLTVPMISGRGLGHSGGTLDKLESIPNLNVFLSQQATEAVIAKHGGSFMGQTAEFAPLDKRLYALRDVTSTVESVGLITASILSKKSAEGLNGLVMDVKYGSGAFMTDIDQALTLAHSIKQVGEANGMRVTCLLTDMDSPLGDAAGNALEVIECVEILQGHGPRDTRDLSLALAAEMVALVDHDRSIEEITASLAAHLSSGRALDKFKQIIAAQGGDVAVLDDTTLLPKASITVEVSSARTGYIEAIDVRALGMAVVELGGGRHLVSDTIDYGVGLSRLKHVGDAVKKNEPLAVVHANRDDGLESIITSVGDAFKIGTSALERSLIHEVIK